MLLSEGIAILADVQMGVLPATREETRVARDLFDRMMYIHESLLGIWTAEAIVDYGWVIDAPHFRLNPDLSAAVAAFCEELAGRKAMGESPRKTNLSDWIGIFRRRPQAP